MEFDFCVVGHLIRGHNNIFLMFVTARNRLGGREQLFDTKSHGFEFFYGRNMCVSM